MAASIQESCCGLEEEKHLQKIQVRWKHVTFISTSGDSLYKNLRKKIKLNLKTLNKCREQLEFSSWSKFSQNLENFFFNCGSHKKKLSIYSETLKSNKTIL